MADVQRDGVRYREIETPTGTTRFDTFLRRLAAVDIVVFHPVLLALMGRPGSDQADRDAAAVALESYLVRRIVCWGQTRGYGEVMRALLAAIAAIDSAAPAAQAVAKALADQTAEATQWPDDQKFRNAWVSYKFYGGYRRSRVLMMLQALEEFYLREGTKGEPIVTFDFSGLEIEHILPQKWEQHWPLADDDKARAERDRRLHGIGNLTLVTGKLNPTLSNAPWLDAATGAKGKRTTFDHSKLQINARLVKTWPDHWDEATIDARAGVLFDAARQIWPSPSMCRFAKLPDDTSHRSGRQCAPALLEPRPDWRRLAVAAVMSAVTRMDVVMSGQWPWPIPVVRYLTFSDFEVSSCKS